MAWFKSKLIVSHRKICRLEGGGLKGDEFNSILRSRLSFHIDQSRPLNQKSDEFMQYV